ncbi:Predicted transcriptional regulator [Enterobacter hormaechei]|jgi:phage repressor protein C with HTH and peptisase S24 domain|uniref:Helix-turn-helix transcriptional regulator n=1 Tax=Leclercia adecarboxylata TaxID=83655 RepID=A0AAP9AFR7_9ENTR|nr:MULTISPECIES: helix-turn-helix transcriptional regulator [Enterobacterales]MCO6614102.1 helix-turn-helix transcriptional regulator [Enterobacter hormaechei]MCO6642572.1 helix-turn-helix transcriptional regulator [Enterobacter hormaechei]MDQ2127269.1 helix-turn-helix transcriptional regulator [Leclercia adecarboxylata]MDV5239948.1 helix-turn-helix transcriptional regulator [Leclercia adecarboxylata]MDV5276512.1 helix-turn-helix transcriptional regulator [Leclercia adecarboxylata]
MNVGQRIRELRKAKKMTINQLASLTDWDVGNISRLERGMQGYSEASLKKIAEALEVPLSELFSFQDKKDTVDKYSINSLSPERKRDVYRVDVMDVSASAGNGNSTRDFIEVISSIEYVTEEARNLFGHRPANQVKLINVRGDSMQGTIEPGDLIFVDVGVNHFDGDGIYVFDFSGDLFVKRLQKIKTQLHVLSDNPLYREWQITDEEMDMLHVCGKVLLSQSQQFRRHA